QGHVDVRRVALAPARRQHARDVDHGGVGRVDPLLDVLDAQVPQLVLQTAAVLGRRLAAGAVESGHEADAAQWHRLDVADVGDVAEGLQLVALALRLLGDLRAPQGGRAGAAARTAHDAGGDPG